MRLALRLAKRAYGETSPNPLVGAVLVKRGAIIGQGWHRRAGQPHAEIEAIRDAERRGNTSKGATLYVTLEPCSTHGKTPPCTEAILLSGIRCVVAGATDPNPKHAGQGFKILRAAGVRVRQGVLNEAATQMNESFNHWITRGTPFVTVKAGMSIDGKIATSSGQSKWITGERARQHAMTLRQGADAVLVGVNTILADNPSLTFRPQSPSRHGSKAQRLRRFVLDSDARVPLTANVIADKQSHLTSVVVAESAPRRRIEALAKVVSVWIAPLHNGKLDLEWLLKRLGDEDVVSLLVEGGGEVNASFLRQGLAHRVALYYAPKILGGRSARKAVAGEGVTELAQAPRLRDIEWRRFGGDFFMTGRIVWEF
jgi:diaminohydroxyphosphoribosylaminopyrimidine deaminase/5-amino-6-(5-phosphoribosylamino)uracil reductase